MLSSEYNWTPPDIRNITYQELVHSFEYINERREKVNHNEVSLELIRKVFFEFLGIKEPRKNSDINEQIKSTKIPTFKFTKAEKDAWIKAGMPNINKFLSEYRKQHGPGSINSKNRG